ncbi:MAG: response regulator transcription factor [Solirubrobacterales bacterium]|nr:response regulator transcription factor [Solirubrobacterales bacterium]
MSPVLATPDELSRQAIRGARVVVCEDDRPTLELLCDHLTADRFEVLAAPTAADALHQCEYCRPDLLLLDLSLPDGSGLDLLREVRGIGGNGNGFDVNLAVIIISGRSSERDRIRGLEQGADDYVLKPFSYSELLARIGAVLRRCGQMEAILRVEGIEVDRRQRAARIDGRLLRLSAKEFELLAVLAGEPTRVFSKEELLREVWGYRSLGHTRTLESHASRLRRKLDPENGRFVTNCWGVGYRLVGP